MEFVLVVALIIAVIGLAEVGLIAIVIHSEDRELEDDEQLKYLKEWRDKKRGKHGK